MTEKIVQLVDKDNNNVYPVAGSLKQGSVTTSTINNNAVTADKIDFSTMTKSFPVATATNVDIGYSIKVTLMRIANIVFVTAPTRIVSFDATHNRAVLPEKIPSGYRPSVAGLIMAPCQDFGALDAKVSWEVGSNGALYLSNSGSGQCRINIGGCWVTADNWPS